jgi:hypothetical protein
MLVVLLAGLLPLFLFALAIDAGIIRTAGSSAPIKKVLADSGIYSSVVSSALDQAKNSAGDSGGGISLSSPGVKTAAENAITPAYLRQNTEKVLDSVYAWLNGKTATPDFSIDVSSIKATFAAEAGKAAQAQAASLPKCTSAQPTNNSFDPFSATCLPAGMTPAQAAATVKNDIASGQGFLKEPAITADSVKSAGTNQSVFNDQLKNAPQAYQKIKKTPIILGILSLVTILGMIFLSTSRRRGLRRAGTILLIVGVVVVIFAWVLNWGVNQKALPKLNMDNKVLQEKVRLLAKDLTGNLDKTYYIFGGVYAALGVLAIGLPMFIHRGRGGHAQPEHAVEAPGPAHPDAPIEHEPEPTKKPSKNIKVQ